MYNDSIKKTLVVTVLLCLVCSIIVSTAAVGLKSRQEFNRELDIRVNILKVSGLYKLGESIDALFKRIESRVINLDDGSFVDIDPAVFDMRRAARDPEQSVQLSHDDDVAQIKRRPHHATIYLVRHHGRLDKVILPISGYGLWSTLHGFLALEADGDTVYRLQFYEHGETPGLGGEVDNPKWQSLWQGKQLYGEGTSPRLKVIKGRVARSDPDANYKVDGLSGATLTSRGITNMLRFWAGESGYLPFLNRVRSKEIS